jgi:hypothetical protein
MKLLIWAGVSNTTAAALSLHSALENAVHSVNNFM